MKTLSYTESCARYAEVLDSVVDDREEVVITRAGHEPVVIVSLEDYEALKETPTRPQDRLRGDPDRCLPLPLRAADREPRPRHAPPAVQARPGRRLQNHLTAPKVGQADPDRLHLFGVAENVEGLEQ